jgi:hypothetical protein
MTTNANAALLDKIKYALKSISANDLQVLAESMSELKRPELKGRALIRQGRNIQSQTNKGWPDAYIETDGDRVFGIEATRQGNWEDHLADDLAKARDPARPNLSGYFFVGGYPSQEPTAGDLKKWSKNFQSLGIKPEAIIILVGKHLAMELANPLYAGLRYSILRISVAPRAFRLMVPGFLVDGNLGEYQPTAEDFTKDLVTVSPDVLAAIETQLGARKSARVIGYGAAGKTTLAQIIACRRSIKPTYYVDLAQVDDQDTSDITEDLIEWAAEGALFVLDNVHHNPQLSADAHRTWETYAKPRDAALLQLGRFTSSDRSGRLGSIVLRAGEYEMRAVVKRLLLRHALPPQILPNNALEDWQQLFGGSSERGVDLIAFSAAIHGQLEAISRGSFRLTPSDSVSAVRSRYLDKLESKERENLYALALVAEHEVALGAHTLPHPAIGLPMCQNRLGIVSEIRRGVHDARIEYSLVHAALGALVQEGHAPTGDHTQALINLIESKPRLGVRLHHRLTGVLRNQVFERVVYALQRADWLNSCSALVEVVTVLRWACVKKVCTSTAGDSPLVPCGQMDVAICGNEYLKRLLGKTRFVKTKRELIEYVTQLRLGRTKDWLLSQEMQVSLESDLASMHAHDVCQFLELHPEPGEVLSRIRLDRWNEAQLAVPPQPMTAGVAAFKFFDQLQHSDFSVVPAKKIILAEDIPSIVDMGTHIGHLSHIVRASRASPFEVVAFLSRISQLDGGFDRFCEKTSIRHLCGAMLSIANYCPRDALELLRPSLHRRVQGLLDNIHQSPEDTVCMLGSYSLVAGQSLSLPSWLPARLANINLFQSSMYRGYINRVGTYEIQMWLGVRYLSLQGICVQIPSGLDTAFLDRLVNATPPSKNALNYQTELRDWMQQLIS